MGIVVASATAEEYNFVRQINAMSNTVTEKITDPKPSCYERTNDLINKKTIHTNTAKNIDISEVF